MIVHLSALSGIVLPVPFANIVVPLIIWHVKRDELPFVAEQGKEVLNFQITVTIALIVSAILILVLIGFLLLPLVAIAALVLTVLGGVKASSGEPYRYPFAIRFLQ